MRFHRSLIAVACTVAPLIGHANSPCVIEAMVRVRNQCGLDLSGPFAASAIDVTVEEAAGKSFRAVFDVKPSRWNERSKVQVAFNCAGTRQVAAPEESTEKGMSASQVIEEEDAGGRYGRRVASVRAIAASNWQGTVAYVDGLLGDGQLSPMTFLLACDSALSRPCIEVQVQPAIPHPGKKLDSIFELVQSISHAP